MSLLRSPSNVSIASHEIPVPWQFKWKRPRVAQTSYSHYSSVRSPKSNRNCNPNYDDHVKNKIPIGSASARLRRNEIDIILKDCLGLISPGAIDNDMDNAPNAQRMKWEDLESESDEERTKSDDMSEIGHDQEEYIVTVTLLASKSLVKLLQAGRDEQVLIPADSILLEVVKDSYIVESDFDRADEKLISERDEVDVVMSKLLLWPSSAFEDASKYEREAVGDQTDEQKSSSGHVEAIDPGEQSIENDEKKKVDAERKLVKELESELLAKANGTNIWKNIRKALNLPTPMQDMNDDEKQSHYKKIKENQIKTAKKKIGATSVTLIRKTSAPGRQVDMDEIMDVLSRMTLGTGLDINPDLLSTRIGHSEENTNDLRQGSSHEKLLLSCLCNDGKVHVFSVLDLLCSHVNDKKDEQINLVDAIANKGSSEEIFINSFEALLFGDSLKASIENSILPLSEPIATIDVSAVAIRGKARPFVENKRRDYQSEENKQANPALLKIQEVGEALGRGLSEFNPQFELSHFDANIETTTMHDITMNNIPFLCAAAFEYILVGGKGERMYRERGELLPEASQQGRNFSGGFVTFISTRYFNETKTIFLPFIPKSITPIVWKSMNMVVILGVKSHHCIAIRTDSSSYVSSASKHQSSIDTVNIAVGTTPKQQLEFIKKFTPIQILFEDLDHDDISSTFPVSVTCMPAHPSKILLCTILQGSFHVQNFRLDSLQFGYLNRKVTGTPFMSGVYIKTYLEPQKFLDIAPVAHSEVLVSDLMDKRTPLCCMENFLCVSGQGWALFSVHISNRVHLFYSSWDGSTEDKGAYYEEIAIIDNPYYRVSSKIINLQFLSVVAGSDEITCDNNQQVAVASLTLGIKDRMKATVAMRSKVISQGISSSYEEVLNWLCEQNDYYMAAIIALSLLEDTATLADIENSLSSRSKSSHGVINNHGILESITPLCLDKENEMNAKSRIKGSVLSYREQHMHQIFVNLSDVAVNCLINGGSTLAHSLEEFLGRNQYYDASSACQVLVDHATQIIRNLNSDDMTHLAPYSYNPLQSEGHALWPIQCLLKLAVTRNCMVTALSLLNERIPDELRQRSSRSQDSEKINNASLSKLSKSIISMILASSSEAGSALMDLEDPTCSSGRLYWDSLDDQTQLSLSMLHVQGRYPLLREFEVKEWALKRLHIDTGLVTNIDTKQLEDILPSEWLRELCTGVLSNAGCDLSQTILFTPAIPINPGETLSTDNKDLFQERQEVDEDLHDYLTAAPGSGGIDFALIIPSFLILERRKINWLGNDKISTQMILNVICDLASEESTFLFDSVPVMKQCVIMENALAAANLIGGEKGLVLQCAFYVAKQGNLNMKDAELILRQEANITDHSHFEDDRSQEDATFILTDGHKALLWLLEQHALRVRKYGDFYSRKRGHINPVFAARICFRSWLYLMNSHPGSGQWLERWLKKRLELNVDNAASLSKRLPHAAVIRALLWTEGSSQVDGTELETNPALALLLDFSMPFLVKLAKVPCGLLECVPQS